ncbi:MAG: sigma-70 family RNA polymerase sigma factor [Planctomycetes bacterium]|nr:sigma-70 family RNA polymerase sigma factor [Planctomycetota bacterium]
MPDAPAPSLGSLLQAVSRRDEGALALLYDATSRWVYGLALRILGDEHAAEEVTLDTYMQVWRTADTYEPSRGSPSGWLSTVARTRAIDLLRARAARHRREEALWDHFDAPGREGPPDGTHLALERRERVLEAVAALPAEQKQAIELAFFHGLTHSEVAERLAEPLGTVKTRIRLGMLKLRGLLKPFEDWS